VTFLVAPIMPFMQAIGFGMLMVTSVARSGDLWTQCLQWKPVAWLGTLSYSLYMWQQLFCTRAEVYGLDSVWWLRFPGWILPSLVVAVMSYYLIEMPALRLKKRSSPPPRIIEGIR
jgi:peptidoglycan/LPS O-acetylase OafA/YrhL